MGVTINSPSAPPSNMLYRVTATQLDQTVNMTSDNVSGYFVTWTGNSNGAITFAVNTDTTATNYYRQYIQGEGSLAVNSANSNALDTMGAGVICNGYAYVFLNTTDQKIVIFGQIVGGTTGGQKTCIYQMYHNVAQTNITKIKISSATGFSATTVFTVFGLR